MKSKLTVALFLLLSVLVIGILGFKMLMDVSWIDAIYMTTITITTVGFKEVAIPDDTTKLFIIFLILGSVIIVAYAISTITEYLIFKATTAGDNFIKKQRKLIEKMENHVIVVGYGRNGKRAVEKLEDYHKQYIIIEKTQEIIESSNRDNKLFVRGNAIDDEILIQAGIEKASTLIAALPKDADNLFVVLSARQLNKNLKIISRASEETSYKKLKLAGADNVILPDSIGGQHMASLVVTPDLLEFWDNLSYGGNQGINLEQLSFEQIFGNQRGCSIKELRKMSKTGCTIIGYKSPDGEYVVNPSPNIMLEPESKIIVIGNSTQIAAMQKEYHLESHDI